MSDRAVKCRLIMGGGLLMLAMIGLGVRLVFLHLYRQGEATVHKRDYTATILAGRGTIHDCRGADNTLALNLVVKDICADPQVIAGSNQVAQVASFLAERLEIPVDELADRLNRPDKKFTYVKRYVPEEEAARILQPKPLGIFLNDTIVRHYPHAGFMCHVLGFVNYEGVGSAGVEQMMDHYLRGSPGYVESCMNARRQELYSRRNSCVPALEGASVSLNVDQNIQYIVEKALDDVMTAHRARGAWAIVQRVKTGEILAMASRPAFDPNNFRFADENSRLNRAIGCNFEPGSTFKVVAISGALNEGTVLPDTEFDCENGAWDYAKHVLRDAHPYGTLMVADIVKKSSNIGAVKVALTLGEKRFFKYLKAFGLGAKTGVDLPGEEQGILHPLTQWSDVSIARLPMGQGISVTALQLLNVFCTIANDGFRMRPYIVKNVARENGVVLYQSEPEVLGRPISRKTAATMREMLRRVTEEGGTGRKACVEGYEVAGKTGTAQKAVGGRYSSTDYVSSFVGFLPAEEPEIGVIVVVDEPQPVHYGGVVAAPVFSVIASQTVRYLDIPPGRMEIASSR